MKLTLRQWRRFKEESVEAMAKVCECSPMTYSEWEKNPEKLKLKAIVLILKHWELSFDDIIFLPEDSTISTENVE